MKRAFINGSVITVDEKDTVCEALLIDGDKICFAGTTEEVLAAAGEDAEITDLAGRTLMPGLIDSHYHPILSGLIGAELDSAMVSTAPEFCKSIPELLDRVKAVVATKKPGEWVSTMGYETFIFPEKRDPTIEELDAIAPDNPVHCMCAGGHTCMYNSKALEYLGVYTAEDAKKYPDDEVEVIDGKLTGLVRGHTHFWLWGQVEYPKAAQEKAAMKSHAYALEHGLTSIHDAGELDRPSYHLMQKLCKNGKFKLRDYMMLHSIFGKPYSKEDNDHWMKLGLISGLGDEHFRIGTCKFMIDGGSGIPSCYTREPYSHKPELVREKGWEREEVWEYIQLIEDHECQATAHAIGDGAIEFMVEGYEHAFEKAPDKEAFKARRHRIEHCTVNGKDDDLIKRMAPMNICPSVNVGQVAYQGANYLKCYGPERMKYVCPIRTMLDYGIKCSFQSDYPSGPAGLITIDGAVNRYDRTTGTQTDKFQAVTVMEAIRCATLYGAYGSYEEDIKGSLEPGKLADVIILSGDILAIDPMDIDKLVVDETIIGGVTEYKRA